MESKFTSFSFKLNSVILGIFVATSLVFGSLIGWSWLKQLNESLRNNGQAIVSKSAIEVSYIFDNARCIGDVYSSNFEIITNDSAGMTAAREQIEKRITSLLQIEPCVTGAFLALSHNQFTGEPTHHYFYNYVGGESPVFHTSSSTQYEKMNWFVEASRSTKPFWSEPVFFGEKVKERSLLYVTPLFDKQKKFTGALAIQVSLDSLQENLSKTKLDGEGFCFLYNRNGDLLTLPSKEHERNYTLETLLDASKSSNFVHLKDQLISGKTDMTQFSSSSLYNNGVNLFYAPCDNNTFVGLALPGNWISSRLISLFVHLSLAFALTLALIVTLVMYYVKKLISPLSRLSATAKLIGEGQFQTHIPPYHANDEIGQLTRSFEEMQRDLNQYMSELKKNVEEKQLIIGELNAAKKIQDGILPKLVEPFPKCDFCLLDASLSPARGVGGDLYDFFYMDENHLALIIGDVSGKGVPAALFMAVTETLQRSIAALLHDPAKIVTKLNKFLLNNNDANMFVTYFIAVIDVNTGKMDYCNAGHNPPYIRRRSGEVFQLTTLHGLPLAIYEETYESSEVTLEPGDLLLLYTDGITEAFNPSEELYGDKRLLEAIMRLGETSPPNIIRGVLDDVAQFAAGREQADDITMLAIRRHNTSLPPQSHNESHTEKEN